MDVKVRDAGYCNLKLFLMFLVIFGHMLEGQLEDGEGAALLYRLIYTFHMPLFFFLCGLFLRDREGCWRQAGQMFGLYGICQIFVVVVWVLLDKKASFGVPFWHLWYLLSLGCMDLAGAAWFGLREKYSFCGRRPFQAGLWAVSVCLACLAGNLEGIGRFLSLSRTLCFFPYFLLGLFLDRGISWEKFRLPGLLALGAYGALFTLAGGKLSAAFLYRADSFAALGIGGEGAVQRLLCLCLALLMGLFLLAWTPGRRFRFSHLGTDTLAAYLFHAPLAALWNALELPPRMKAALTPALAAYCLLLCSRCAMWRRELYRIPTGGDNRSLSGWMKSRLNRSLADRKKA